MVSRGRTAAYRQTHARILLLSDEVQGNGAMRDEDIARYRDFVFVWSSTTLVGMGTQMADRLVEREIVESISRETVRQTLKKTNSSPG